MDISKAGPVIIAFAYLALLVFIVLFSGLQSDGFEEFAQYWGLFGTLVGVVTGAIPAFFFKADANKADTSAQAANKRAEIYASIADPERVSEAEARLADTE